MTSVKDLFLSDTAKSHSYSSYEAGGTAFVSNGLSNNGVIGYVAVQSGDKVCDTKAICVSAFCEATVQPPPFIARGNGGSGLIVLQPKQQMTDDVLLWYAAYINQCVRWRFSFGRMVTADRLAGVALPPKPGGTKIDVASVLPSQNKVVVWLPDIELVPIPLSHLFVPKSGDYHNADSLPCGVTPLVSCGTTNNGVVRYCSVPEEHMYRDALTIAYNGSWPLLTKFHPYTFAAKDDVAVLQAKQPLQITSLLFVQMMLNRETWRYSYGRKCFFGKLSRVTVNLPVNDGELDEAIAARVIQNTSYWEFVSTKTQPPSLAANVNYQPTLI